MFPGLSWNYNTASHGAIIPTCWELQDAWLHKWLSLTETGKWVCSILHIPFLQKRVNASLWAWQRSCGVTFAKSSGLGKIPPRASLALSPVTHLEAQLLRNPRGDSALWSLMYFERFCYKNLGSKSSITNATVEANQFFYWQELVFFGEMVLLTK